MNHEPGSLLADPLTGSLGNGRCPAGFPRQESWLLAFITRWLINAILLVVTDKLTDHLKIDSFGWALGGALVMSLVGTLGEWVVRSVF